MPEKKMEPWMVAKIIECVGLNHDERDFNIIIRKYKDELLACGLTEQDLARHMNGPSTGVGEKFLRACADSPRKVFAGMVVGCLGVGVVCAMLMGL